MGSSFPFQISIYEDFTRNKSLSGNHRHIVYFAWCILYLESDSIKHLTVNKLDGIYSYLVGVGKISKVPFEERTKPDLLRLRFMV